MFTQFNQSGLIVTEFRRPAVLNQTHRILHLIVSRRVLTFQDITQLTTQFCGSLDPLSSQLVVHVISSKLFNVDWENY